MFNQEHMEEFVATGTTLLPDVQTPEDSKINQQLEEVERRLVTYFTEHHEVPEGRIRSTVEAVRARFVNARVRTYLPILVERAARSELAASQRDREH